MKECAHRTPDDFGVPEVNGAWHRDDRGRAQSRGRGPYFLPERSIPPAGILNGIQHDQASTVTERQIVQPGLGNLGDREDPLRGVGLGRARELAVVDLDELGAVAPRNIEKGGSTLGTGELRGDQQTAHGERRSEQLLDGPHAFGDEEALTLASTPAPEVAG